MWTLDGHSVATWGTQLGNKHSGPQSFTVMTTNTYYVKKPESNQSSLKMYEKKIPLLHGEHFVLLIFQVYFGWVNREYCLHVYFQRSYHVKFTSPMFPNIIRVSILSVKSPRNEKYHLLLHFLNSLFRRCVKTQFWMLARKKKRTGYMFTRLATTRPAQCRFLPLENKLFCPPSEHGGGPTMHRFQQEKKKSGHFQRRQGAIYAASQKFIEPSRWLVIAAAL